MDERVLKVINERPWVVPATVGAASFALGLGVGYLLGKRYSTEVVHVTQTVVKNPEPHFEATVEDIEKVKSKVDHPAGTGDILKRGVKAMQELDDSLQEAEEELEALDDADIVPEATEEEPLPDGPIEHVNVFERSVNGEWNYEEQLAARVGEDIYVIHQDEFFNNEMEGYSQTTITYYAGDDILTDSADVPVYGHEGIIGELKFGFGSDDEDTFYVRNDRLKAEYEILRDPGRFSEIILGLEADAQQTRDELKHSRNLRFRPDD